METKPFHNEISIQPRNKITQNLPPARVAALLLGCLLSACTVQNGYKNYSGADAACVSGNSISPLEFTKGQSSTVIEYVDSISTEGGKLLRTGKICFSPGRHSIFVAAYRDRWTQSHVEIERDFPAGSSFVTKAKVGNRLTTFWLYEIRNSQEIEVDTYSVGSERDSFF